MAFYAQDPIPTGTNPYTGTHGWFEGKAPAQLLAWQGCRARIPTRPLLALASEVSELRRAGADTALLARAISRLEQDDPQWQREFDDLYGESLRAMQRGDLVQVDLDSFGPED